MGEGDKIAITRVSRAYRGRGISELTVAYRGVRGAYKSEGGARDSQNV